MLWDWNFAKSFHLQVAVDVIKLAVIAAPRASAVAVLIFEVVLNATAMFNHLNIRLTKGVERALRWFVVTPDMHRVHHSVVPVETNSNSGFNLPLWDRLLGTYRAQPKAGLIKKFVDTLVWVILPVFLVAQVASLTEMGWIAGVYGFVWGGSHLFTGRHATGPWRTSRGAAAG